ncbi:hypothetical protein G4H71_03890 [Rhodococcus triatomae]|uniref:Secreted protein n=1 Tax=Rhodococcus triatomae TaxID=300028 RepID=A0A1G7ZGX0_9NOCA|nr:hypothetical protein [Rhodococcus triatomae]QNG18044.1 hypothetical protein G4H72_04150 [Rhodococcus triatomae]QNG22285.1 hypothetical protein G4H71_03890 [Rhodococcus triatomae]SDH07786.1 hypothetical protein SAMN05444695_101104 [Rhodococcus triatomae]
MLRTRGLRRGFTALAIAAAAALVVPSQAGAQPIPPPVPEGVPVEALASLVPAIIGAAAGPADIADNPQADLLAQARILLETAPLSDELKSTLERVITFLDGSGGGGPDIPEDGPVIAQFLYPTIGQGCIGPESDAVATALAVPGPAHLPPPGPGVGQAGFVFTALGTAPAADHPAQPLTATWINIDNGWRGDVDLTNQARINPDGPATLSGIADTGSGRVLAVISGGITTVPEGEAPISCMILPTVGMFHVA